MERRAFVTRVTCRSEGDRWRCKVRFIEAARGRLVEEEFLVDSVDVLSGDVYARPDRLRVAPIGLPKWMERDVAREIREAYEVGEEGLYGAEEGTGLEEAVAAARERELMAVEVRRYGGRSKMYVMPMELADWLPEATERHTWNQVLMSALRGEL